MSTKIREDLRNPLRNPDHPFTYRSEPPSNMVDITDEAHKEQEFVWTLEDRVSGVQWVETDEMRTTWEMAEERLVIRRMQAEGCNEDDDFIRQVTNARRVD